MGPRNNSKIAAKMNVASPGMGMNNMRKAEHPSVFDDPNEENQIKSSGYSNLGGNNLLDEIERLQNKIE